MSVSTAYRDFSQFMMSVHSVLLEKDYSSFYRDLFRLSVTPARRLALSMVYINYLNNIPALQAQAYHHTNTAHKYCIEIT